MEYALDKLAPDILRFVDEGDTAKIEPIDIPIQSKRLNNGSALRKISPISNRVHTVSSLDS
jgi:hypothetical protein